MNQAVAVAKTENVRFDEQHGVLVAHLLAPRVMHETTFLEIQDAILAQIPNASKGVLIDCASVTGPVSSQFLGLLASLRKTCKQSELQFGLVNVGGSMREAVKVTNLDSIIPIHDSLHDAVYQYRVGSDGTRAETPPATRATWDWSNGSVMVPAAGALAALLVFAVVAALSAGWFSAADPRLAAVKARELRDNGPEFETELIGQVVFGTEADEGALLIAWPVELSLAAKLAASEVRRMAEVEEQARDWPSVILATEGKFALPIGGRGDELELQVLTVSAHQERLSEITVEDRSYLAAVLDEPEELIGKQAFDLRRVVVSGRESTEISVEFP